MGKTIRDTSTKSKLALTTAQVTKIALFVALTGVSAYIAFPLPFTSVLFSVQTMMVCLVGLLLSPVEAGITMAVYWLVGLIGIPVFSGGTAGPARVFGPNGGFLIGFIVAVILISLLRGEKYNLIRYLIVTVAVSMVSIYGCAVVWWKFVTGNTWAASFTAAALPFIPLDTVKCILAVLLAKPLQEALKAVQRG